MMTGAMCALLGMTGYGSGGASSDASTGSESSGEGTGETNGEALACPAPTAHEGALGMNEVWTADAGPHVVTRFVSVPEGATLAKLVDVTIRKSVGHGVVAEWTSSFMPGSSDDHRQRQ